MDNISLHVVKEHCEVEVNVALEPEKVAELFWSMYADEQRVFFNHLGKIADLSGVDAIDYQLYKVMVDETPTPPLDDHGHNVLRAITDNFRQYRADKEDHG